MKIVPMKTAEPKVKNPEPSFKQSLLAVSPIIIALVLAFAYMLAV